MQHLHACLAARAFRTDSGTFQARVRFLAYHRIKPHVPPLVRAPVNSFEFHRCVSNPVRYPHLRASTSVTDWQAAFAIGVLRDIYAFHRYTTSSACRDRTQGLQFQLLHAVEPRDFTADLKARLRSL